MAPSDKDREGQHTMCVTSHGSAGASPWEIPRDLQNVLLEPQQLPSNDQPQMFVQATPPHKIHYVNAAWCRLLGFSMEEAVGKNLDVLSGPETCLATFKALSGTMIASQRLTVVLLSYSKFNNPILITVAASPLADASGKFSYYLLQLAGQEQHQQVPHKVVSPSTYPIAPPVQPWQNMASITPGITPGTQTELNLLPSAPAAAPGVNSPQWTEHRGSSPLSSDSDQKNHEPSIPLVSKGADYSAAQPHQNLLPLNSVPAPAALTGSFSGLPPTMSSMLNGVHPPSALGTSMTSPVNGLLSCSSSGCNPSGCNPSLPHHTSNGNPVLNGAGASPLNGKHLMTASHGSNESVNNVMNGMNGVMNGLHPVAPINGYHHLNGVSSLHGGHGHLNGANGHLNGANGHLNGANGHLNGAMNGAVNGTVVNAVVPNGMLPTPPPMDGVPAGVPNTPPMGSTWPHWEEADRTEPAPAGGELPSKEVKDKELLLDKYGRKRTRKPGTNDEPRVAPFVSKLFTIVDSDSTDNCVRWSHDGRSFWIVDPDQLETYVLPCFFKHNRLAFFIKQLKAYGFKRKLGESCLHIEKEWFHDKFVRYHKDLLPLIARVNGSQGESGCPASYSTSNCKPPRQTEDEEGGGAASEVFSDEVHGVRTAVMNLNSLMETKRGEIGKRHKVTVDHLDSIMAHMMNPSHPIHSFHGCLG